MKREGGVMATLSEVMEIAGKRALEIQRLEAEVERLREIIVSVEGNWHFKDCLNSSWPLHECGCMKRYAQAALEGEK